MHYVDYWPPTIEELKTLVLRQHNNLFDECINTLGPSHLRVPKRFALSYKLSSSHVESFILIHPCPLHDIWHYMMVRLTTWPLNQLKPLRREPCKHMAWVIEHDKIVSENTSFVGMWNMAISCLVYGQSRGHASCCWRNDQVKWQIP